MSRDKMIEVLHDIQLAESIIRSNSEDFKLKEQKEALIEGVLEKHNITRAQLDSSLVWYSDNVDAYTRVNDSVIASLKRDSEQLSKQIYRGMRSSYTFNYGILPGFYHLSDANPLLTFDIDTLRVKRLPGLKFDFKTMWINKDTDADVFVSFQYRDTTINESFKLTKDTAYTIGKPQIDDLLKTVSGYIYLDVKDRLNQNILLYDIVVTDSIKTEPASSDSGFDPFGMDGPMM